MRKLNLILTFMLLSMTAFSSRGFAEFIYDITQFEQNGFVDTFSDGNEPTEPTYWLHVNEVPFFIFDPNRETGGLLELNSDDAGLLDGEKLIAAPLNDNTRFFYPGAGGYLIGSFEVNDGFWPGTRFGISIANYIVSGPPPSTEEEVYMGIYTDSSGNRFAVWGDINNEYKQDITGDLGTSTDITVKLSLNSSNQVTAQFDYGSDGTFELNKDNFATLAFYPQSEGDRLYSGVFWAQEAVVPEPVTINGYTFDNNSADITHQWYGTPVFGIIKTYTVPYTQEKYYLSVVDTQVVYGVNCVRTKFFNEAETQWFWFARDTDGNIHHFKKIENGVTSEVNSDDDIPNFEMIANPSIGSSWSWTFDNHQTNTFTVESVSETVSTFDGITFTNCMKIKETGSASGDIRYHYYARGIGLIKNKYDGTIILLQTGGGGSCDINGDGRTGLEEAIFALQVVAGMKPSINNVSGYWKFYYTEAGGQEEGPDYIVLIQSGDNVAGSWLCGDSEGITGSIIGTDVNLSWIETGGSTSITGKVDGNTMTGIYSNGTWRAEKTCQILSKECVLSSVDSFCVRFEENDQYWVEGKIEDTESIIESATISGYNITGTSPLTYNLYAFKPNEWWTDPNIFISQGVEPTFPLYYTIHLNFKDGSTVDIFRTVNDWEWAE